MTLKLSPEKLAEYKRGALARRTRDVQKHDARRERAWVLARRAAGVLKQEFGAAQVLAFGSLLYPEDFGPQSDIDLAVEGIGWPAYFRAWASEDRYFPLSQELAMLGRAGFEVEVAWRRAPFAVLVGRKT